MRLHRFYVNKPLGEELVVESAGSEKEILHQLLHVFRYKAGDEVFLFSPHHTGQDFRYQITSATKDRLSLSRVGVEQNTVSSTELVLCMALVKKDTFETIVRQATELGVTSIIPISAERSEKKSLNFKRLEKIATEAAEQSGRGTVPIIRPIMVISKAIEETRHLDNIVGSLHGNSSIPQGKGVAVWVGPEGGWTEKEENFFIEQGFHMLRTVSTILKADTAAVNLLSVILGCQA